jgi:carboxyl-terminal processing protease
LRVGGFFLLGLVVAALAVVRWFDRPSAPAPKLGWPEEARREIQGVVESRYVEAITAERQEELFDAAMKGYVEDLDPFSRYYTAKERAQLDEETSGAFGGIGVRIDVVPAGLLVVAVRRGGPAEAAGIEPGDTIEKVAGEPLTGRDRDAMIEAIKGLEGTTVALSVRAPSGDERAIAVTRGKVELDTVPAVRTFDGAPRIGYLRLSQFSDATTTEARDGLRTLTAQGVGGLVLDLRRNLGGVVQAAVDLASLLLPEDSLVCTSRARDGGHAYRTALHDGFEPIVALPLVVLVDENSASASEILAGALQDHGRAALVGERTYGKFVMQTIVPLARRGAMLRLTTARYETPRGRTAQRDPDRGVLGGLQPDVRVPLRTADERRALEESFVRQAGLAWRVLPSHDRSAEPPDPQLAAALSLLRGGAAPPEPIPPRAN